MSVETAETIVYAVAGIGIVVWFAGLRFMMSAARLPRVMRDTATENFDATGPLPENVVADSAEVAGNAAELARKAASLLASRMLGQMGQLKILEADDEHVVFDGMDHALPHQGVGRGQLRFTSVSANQSTVTYAVVASGGKGLLIGGVVCVVLGALALSVGFWLITIYVVAHPNPGVRGQACQMVQTVHFLWPPFLFGSLYRRRYTVVRNTLDAFIHNLPYCDFGGATADGPWLK